MAEQRTDEWFAARIGKATGSRIADIVRKTTSGPAASRKNYLAQLACERLTGQREETFQSGAMQWGTDTEPQARTAYEFHRDADVIEVGFVPHPRIPDSGASPDGLVGDDGLVEIKCPNTATHIETLSGANIKPDYIIQMQWQMACTGREWCDFVSFDPRLPPAMQMFCQRVERDDEMISDLEQQVEDFLGELNATVADLQGRYGQVGSSRETGTKEAA